MAIPSRQIGWSTNANLLWEISKQLERLICVRSGGCTTTTTTTVALPNITLLVENHSYFNIISTDQSRFVGESDFTIEYYINVLDDGNSATVWNFGNISQGGTGFGIGDSSLFYFINGTIVYTNYGNLPINRWGHICIERKANDIYVFIDGDLIGSFTYPGAISTNGFPLNIGSDNINPFTIFNGRLSNFRFVQGLCVYPTEGFEPPGELSNIIEHNIATVILTFQGDSLPLELTDNSPLENTLINISGVYNEDNPFYDDYIGSIQFGTPPLIKNGK